MVSSTVQNYSHKVDFDIFSDLSNPYSCYALGFLWADGYLLKTKTGSYRISVEIITEDSNEIFPIFSKNGQWLTQHRTRLNRKPQSCISTSNKPLFNWLSNFNYTSKNLSPINLINQIPKNNQHYWYRGYWDGDGCFYHYKYMWQGSCSGPYNQEWDFIIQLFENLDICYQIQRRETQTGNSSGVRFAGKSSWKNFGDFIYQQQIFGLSRKFNKWNLLNQIINSPT